MRQLKLFVDVSINNGLLELKNSNSSVIKYETKDVRRLTSF